MKECADRLRSVLAYAALFLIQKHRRQPGTRGGQVAGKKLAGRWLAHHLRENLEVRDPQRTVGFKGGDHLCPSRFKALFGCDRSRYVASAMPVADPGPTPQTPARALL